MSRIQKRSFVPLVLIMIMLIALTAACNGQNSGISDTPSSPGQGVPNTPAVTPPNIPAQNVPVSPAHPDPWLSLDEIQGRAGVYIKRDDKFFELKADPGVDVQWHTPTATRNPSSEIIKLESGDQLVYVGMDIAPRLYSASFENYVAGYRSDRVNLYYLNIRETTNPMITFTDTPGRASDHSYTHIDGLEVNGNPLLETNIFWRNQRNYFGGLSTGVFLVGSENQVFTLGKWEGTSWVETQVRANREFYHLTEQHSDIIRTTHGYFYLDFPDNSGGFLLLQPDPSRDLDGVILELEQGQSQSASSPGVEETDPPESPPPPTVPSQTPASPEPLSLAQRTLAAYRAYYDILKTAADEFGIGYNILNHDDGHVNLKGVVYAELIDFDNDGLPELLFYYGDDMVQTGPVGRWVVYGFSSQTEQHFSLDISWGDDPIINIATDGTNKKYFFVGYHYDLLAYSTYYTLAHRGWHAALTLSHNYHWNPADSDFFRADMMVNGVPADDQVYDNAIETELGVLDMRLIFTMTSDTNSVTALNSNTVGTVLAEIERKIAELEAGMR